MNDNQRLLTAIKIATNAHGMQLDKGGNLYILHPLYVMHCVDGIDAKIVAVMHDVVEDTDVTLAGLDFMIMPDVYDRHKLGRIFTPQEIAAIDAITKRKGEKKRDYWARVKANPLALRVKLADMAHNSSEERLAALPKEEQDYLRLKYDEARKFFAENGGLLPIVIGQKLSNATKTLEAMGYPNACSYLMQHESMGSITIKVDTIVT